MWYVCVYIHIHTYIYIYIYIYIYTHTDTHTHTHTHTHTMEYYSTIKKNEILPFATTWMELEGIMLSEIREKQKSYDFTHKRTLRYKIDENKGREAKTI